MPNSGAKRLNKGVERDKVYLTDKRGPVIGSFLKMMKKF
jgi:hypothetical protein